MAQICEQLADAPGIEEAVQLGDVYSALIKHYFSKGDANKAYQYYEKMKRKRVQVIKYLDQQMVEDLHKAVGMQMPSEGRNNNIGDDIEEDIPEDF